MTAPGDGSSTTTAELRRFGYGAAVGLTVLAWTAHVGKGPFALLPALPAGIATPVALAIAGLALFSALASVLAPRWNRPLFLALQVVPRALGFSALAVFYFGVLTPLALIGRVFGRDPLDLAQRRARDSYWRTARRRDKQSYFHQS
jgi:hypothetical protein